MPSQKAVIKAYVSDEELEHIIQQATFANVSISEFVKRVCLGRTLESKEDARHTLELIKLHADMGRIGGLLKLAITTEPILTHEIRPLLNDLLEVKEKLKKKILDL